MVTRKFKATTTGDKIFVKAPASRAFKSLALKIAGIAVDGYGAESSQAADAWSVTVQGSLDGSNYETILTHNNGDESDGDVIFTGTSFYACKYFKVNVGTLTLGSATRVDVTVTAE